MKVIILIFLLFQLCSCYKPAFDKHYKIEKGVLNLKSYNFEEQGNIYLNGQWKFQWMDYDNIDYIKVPAYWDKEKYSKYGFGWYILEIHHNGNEELGLFLERVHSSYEMYINDELVLFNGFPGNSKEETVPSTEPKVTKLPAESPILIKLKVSNFHHFEGGAFYTPIIGKYHDLKYIYHLSSLIDSILIGAFLIMAIHYLILYLKKKNEKAHLFFSLLCFSIFARTIACKHYIYRIFPVNCVSVYHLSNKIDYLFVAIAAICVIILFKELLPNIFRRKVTNILLYIWSAYTLFVFVSPMIIYQQIHVIIEILMLITILSIIEAILKSVIRGNKNFIFTLTGSILLFLSIVNDVLIFNNIIISIHLTHLGLFLFILSNSIVISNRFAKAFTKAEYLTRNLETEVKKATEIIEHQKNELQEIYNNKTSYFVNIAHEIRTPLTLINNYMEKYINKVGVDENLSIVKKNIEHLVRNITNIFNLQSIELGKVIFNHDNLIEVTQIVSNKIILFKSLALNKKVFLSANISNEESFTEIDPIALDNIINNLIENAIKYTSEFGEIVIKVETSNDIKIKIFNSGEGIPEKQLENIYKPYYQINHQKKNIQGIGLGLSLVKKIIEEVQGKIEVISKSGKGTEFCVTLNRIFPIEDNSAVSKDDNTNILDDYNYSILKPNKYIVERNTILVVEDNLELLSYLQGIFYNDFNVFCGRNGIDAINQLDYIPQPDLIISDIMMDNMDGIEFFAEINKIDKFRYVPFIFLTAKTEDESKLKCLKSGAIDFIPKPFNKSELLLKVSSILNLTNNIKDSHQLLINKDIELNKMYAKYGVSNRQIEIISLLKEGLERKEIAYELGISINTVKTQLQRLYEKCSVNNKTELIKIFN